MTEIIKPEIETNTEQDTPIVIDAPWIASQVMAILYFIEFTFGEESAMALEETARSIEMQMRASETAGHN